MSDIKVSIIVPVFNAQKYLDQCINSLIDQTLKEIEIIIINDGSSDASLAIIEKWIEKDCRLNLVNQNNRGVSEARNMGIKLARGKYIGFVDADDYVSPDFYETLFDGAMENNADWAISNINVLMDKIQPHPRLQLQDGLIKIFENRNEELKKVLAFKYDYSNWNKIYLSKLIRKQNLLFSNGMSVWEDLLFNLKYLQFSSLAIIIDQPLYFYRVHAASTMGNSKLSLSKEYNLLYENFTSFCISEGFTSQLNIFKDERSATWLGNIVNLIDLSSSGNPGLWPKVNRLKTEVKELKNDIYKHNNYSGGRLNFAEKFLLKHKFFGFFSLVTIGKKKLKADIRTFLSLVKN